MRDTINKGTALERCYIAEDLTKEQIKLIRDIQSQLEELEKLNKEIIKKMKKTFRSDEFDKLIGSIAGNEDDKRKIKYNFMSHVSNFDGLKRYFDRVRKFFR